MSNETPSDPDAIKARLLEIHGPGDCGICCRQKIEPGERYCIYPHAAMPHEPIKPGLWYGFWSWVEADAAENMTSNI